MRSLDTIVVGIDFSNCSDAALAEAVRLARKDGARLVIVHVLERLVLSWLTEHSEAPETELRERIARRAAELVEPTVDLADLPTGSEVRVLFGERATPLLALAEEVEADLVVVGAWGSEGSGRGAGTFATRCLRRAHCDVLLVDADHAGPFRMVVACTDLRRQADLAIPHAARAAERDAADFAVLHVFKGPWRQVGRVVFEDEPDAATRAQYVLALEAEVLSRLDQHRDALRGRKQWAVALESTRPGEAIGHWAESHGADLLVLGAHKPGTLRYAVLGSTRERILRNLRTSLLSIRTPLPD